MRHIVFTLIALNLAYLGYNLFFVKAVAPDMQMESAELPTIKLLKGSGDRLSRKRQMDQVVNNPVRVPESKTFECTAIGPFSSIIQGQTVLERLEALEVSVELRAIDQTMGEFDHRVMIAPAASLEAAFRNLRELQSQKIASYVITRGEHTLGISLGVFSNLESAIQLREEMLAAGYNVDIVNIARLNRAYWIFSGEGPHLTVDKGFLESLRSEFPEVDQNAQMCVHDKGTGWGTSD